MGKRTVEVVIPAVNMGDSIRAFRHEASSGGDSASVAEARAADASKCAGASYRLMESRRSRKAGSGRHTKYWWRGNDAVMQIQVDTDGGRPGIVIARFATQRLESDGARQSLADAIQACVAHTSLALERSQITVALDGFKSKIETGPDREEVHE